MDTSVEMKSIFSGHRLGLALFVANVIGAITYIFASMASWARPEELAQGVHSVTGEPFVWATRTWPIFICFGLLNLIWMSRIKRWRDSYFLIAIAMTWLIAVWIDFAHH
jgi:cell division protein FtsW (lipid II flippase)